MILKTIIKINFKKILESLCNWNFDCNKSVDLLSLLKASVQKAFESSSYFKLDGNKFKFLKLYL